MSTAHQNSLPTLPEGADAAAILRAGIEAAGGPVALASSFGIEDVVVIDMIRELQLPVAIFALDTGRLPEETYQTAEAVAMRYGVRIDWYFPERSAVEELERDKGLFSFRNSLEDRHQCCAIRKVEPLQRALAGLSGWVTGMRAEQSVTRSALAPLEIDAAHGGIVKINPLAAWSEAEVRAYAEKRNLPINPLHKQGYPSIGCAPCTRAIEPGESSRAGRWWWEDPEHKECGLHRK
jgi:phosphoadenosine phosphosulfate reductase